MGREADRKAEPSSSTSGRWRIVAAVAGVAFLVVLLGGYGQHWRWTGFSHNATLWDWLHLLVLPLAFVAAPLWLRHRGKLDGTRRLLLALAAGAFGLLVVLGYSLDLEWTGFPGNRLWDWLELLVLPLAVVLIPVWAEISSGFRPRHVAALGCAAAALAVAVVGGYAYGWRWTGFQGNTLFDWLQLFVAPLVLPLVLVPLVPIWMGIAEKEDEEPAPTAEPGVGAAT